MDAQQRRQMIASRLAESSQPLSAGSLAQELSVSRQIIVGDVALLRANGCEIFSASRGYLLHAKNDASRIFKVLHSDEEVEEELTMIVDLGGRIQDVFVYHKVYGVVRADMNIRSRKDIRTFMEGIISGNSSLLKNVTSGYHYHTVFADDEQSLDVIQESLQNRGFLARLQDYEPVDFRGQ